MFNSLNQYIEKFESENSTVQMAQDYSVLDRVKDFENKLESLSDYNVEEVFYSPDENGFEPVEEDLVKEVKNWIESPEVAKNLVGTPIYIGARVSESREINGYGAEKVAEILYNTATRESEIVRAKRRAKYSTEAADKTETKDVEIWADRLLEKLED